MFCEKYFSSLFWALLMFEMSEEMKQSLESLKHPQYYSFCNGRALTKINFISDEPESFISKWSRRKRFMYQ